MVWTLTYNGKLANQIARLAAIVVKKILRTTLLRVPYPRGMHAHANIHAVSSVEKKYVLYIGYEINRRVKAKLPKLREANSILVLLFNNIHNKTNVI